MKQPVCSALTGIRNKFKRQQTKELDMQESTNNNRNESQPQQPKVKIWKTHSVHQTHANAAAARDGIGGLAQGKGCPETKIRLRARGFLVKTWDGSMQSAPSPKPKKQDNAPVSIGLGL